jgi:hypothetical protein
MTTYSIRPTHLLLCPILLFSKNTGSPIEEYGKRIQDEKRNGSLQRKTHSFS